MSEPKPLPWEKGAHHVSGLSPHPCMHILIDAQTQLAQQGISFCDFARTGVSGINGLCNARGRFWHIVPTLGIFFGFGCGSDEACIAQGRVLGIYTCNFSIIPIGRNSEERAEILELGFQLVFQEFAVILHHEI